jgi:hypothetical protein
MLTVRARRSSIRALPATGLSLGLSLGLALTALPAHAATPHHSSADRGVVSTARQQTNPLASYGDKGHLAAEWQASQLHNGRMPGFSPGHPDWGLTIDTAFMLAADGSMATILAQVKKAIAGHILDYAVFKGDTSSGAMAKALLVSEVLKGDPTDFGGLNLRKRVLKLVAPPSEGFEAGRLRDTGKTDYSNVFGQSYGTIGLSRSGSVPQDVVDYLLKQQCSPGYFRLFITAGETCDQSGSDPDVDATALAVQALIAAKADGASVSHQDIERATSWLVSVQSADGSYSEDATDDAPSSNSTGLAANALVAAGHASPRLKAAAYVASMQLTRAKVGDGPAKPDIGAIAFDPAALADAIAHGLGDSRSQWWRVAPQAAFALVPAPLGTLTAP